MASCHAASQSWLRIWSTSSFMLGLAGVALQPAHSVHEGRPGVSNQGAFAVPRSASRGQKNEGPQEEEAEACDVTLTEHICPDAEIPDDGRICLPPAGWRISDCTLVARGRAVVVAENLRHTTSVIRVEDRRRLTLQGNFEFVCKDCKAPNCVRAIKAQYSWVVLNGTFTFENFCVTKSDFRWRSSQDHLTSSDGGTLLAQVLEITPNSVVSIIGSKAVQGRGGAIAAEHLDSSGSFTLVNTSAELDGGGVAILPAQNHQYILHSWHMECKNRVVESRIMDLALNPQGEKLAILGAGCEQMWFSASTGLADGRLVRHPSAWPHVNASAHLVSWSADGEVVAIGMRHDGMSLAYVFEPVRDHLNRIDPGHGFHGVVKLGPGRVSAIQFSHDGKFLAYGAGPELGIIFPTGRPARREAVNQAMAGDVTSLAWGPTDLLAVAAGGRLSLYDPLSYGLLKDWLTLALFIDDHGELNRMPVSYRVDKIAWNKATNQLAAWGVRQGQGSHTLTIFNVTEPGDKPIGPRYEWPRLVIDEIVEMPQQLVALEWHTSARHLVYAYSSIVLLRAYPLVQGKRYAFRVRDNVTVVRVNATGGQLVVGTEGGHVISLDVSSRLGGPRCKSCAPKWDLGISLRSGSSFTSCLARRGSGGAIYSKGGFLWASRVNISAAAANVGGGAIYAATGDVYLEDAVLGPDNGCALGENDATLNYNSRVELRSIRLRDGAGGFSLQIGSSISDEANPCKASMASNISCPEGHMVYVRRWPNERDALISNACLVQCKPCAPNSIFNPEANSCEVCPPGLVCRHAQADLRLPRTGKQIVKKKVGSSSCQRNSEAIRENQPSPVAAGTFWNFEGGVKECWQTLCEDDGYEIVGDHCHRCKDGWHAESGRTTCTQIPIRFADVQVRTTKSRQTKVLVRMVNLSGQASVKCTVCRLPERIGHCTNGSAGLDSGQFSVDLDSLRPGWAFKGNCTVFFYGRSKTSEDFEIRIPMSFAARSFYGEPAVSMVGAVGVVGLAFAVGPNGKLKRRPVLATMAAGVLIIVCAWALAAVSSLPEERGTVASFAVRIVEILVAITMVVVGKLRRAERDHSRVMEDQLNQALRLVREVTYPFALMRADELISNGRLLSHEEARSRCLLHLLDTVQEAKDFLCAEGDEDDEAQGAFAVFFSHQWTAYDAPDPTGQQFSTVCDALRALGVSTGRDLSTMYCWVDYFSIPQANQHIQRLAINSLPIYASLLNAFVIVAPAVTHQNTGGVCDRNTYQQRGWCRAEQLCHCVRRGTANMYLAGEFGLRRLDGVVPQASARSRRSTARGRSTFRGRPSQVELKRWFSQALCVFSPDSHFSCCRMNHSLRDGTKKVQCDREALMLPMLGLYAEIYRNRLDEDSAALFHEIQKDREVIFPRNFEYISERGVQTRPLFSDLIQRLECKLDDQEKGAVQRSVTRAAGIPGPTRRLRPLLDIVMMGTRLRTSTRELPPEAADLQLVEFSARDLDASHPDALSGNSTS